MLVSFLIEFFLKVCTLIQQCWVSGRNSATTAQVFNRFVSGFVLFTEGRYRTTRSYNKANLVNRRDAYISIKKWKKNPTLHYKIPLSFISRVFLLHRKEKHREFILRTFLLYLGVSAVQCPTNASRYSLLVKFQIYQLVIYSI